MEGGIYLSGKGGIYLSGKDYEIIKQRLEFSWDGNAEMDNVNGRGWAEIRDGELYGKLYFYGGDKSWFKAK